MRSLHISKDVILGFLKSFREPLWVEILTSNPHCIYYFGSFPNRAEAEAACPGYIEDLENEGSQVLKVIIKPCQPKMLTRCDEEVFWASLRRRAEIPLPWTILILSPSPTQP